MSRLYKNEVFPFAPFYSRRTLLSDAPGQSAPHDHDFYEFFIVEEGPLLHHINGRTEVLYPDTLVFIQPEDYHSFTCKDKLPARFFNMAFDTELYRQAKELAAACGSVTEDTPLMKQVAIPHELSRLLLRRMKWLRDVNYPTPEELQRTESATLLADVIVLQAMGSGNANSIPYWLRKACNEMYHPENMVEGIPRLVALSGKTQEHLTRSMRKYMNQSPSAYVNSIRLERAAEALVTTQRSVFDIMLDVGFQNTSYFNKLFKDKYHVSPRKYRSVSMSILGKTE